MAPKIEEIRVQRVENSHMRFVTLELSRLAFEALGESNKDGAQERAEAKMELAIRFYLRDREASRPEWPYPAFLRGSEVSEEVALRLGLETDLWRAFETEAARQDVSIAQLGEHAAFYLAAELDAGRITQRILDDLASTEADG
ncbi:MAG TPA: hypothetical protein VGO36_07360 [Solirubrobacterales bacterium]|jgi:hypothetical protein|nr:hypothetical protein [Solirubrobacterales bacterium]